MANIAIGTTVRIGSGKKAVFGVVRTAGVATPLGTGVSVQLLPDFQHTTVTGWADYLVTELTEVRVCACATLGYRPQWGDNKGQLFTTGCDYSRMPGRNSKFLPGHDAKAKGFLIKASGLTDTLTNGKGALETARDLGDKISMKVAEGMDNERRKRDANARGRKNLGARVERPTRAATREDQLTDAQRLQAKHKVTQPMMEALASALVQHDGMIVRTTTGTTVALQTRDLVSWGEVTPLGRKVMDYPLLDADQVVCDSEEGEFTKHTYHTSGCRRCGADWDENTAS